MRRILVGLFLSGALLMAAAPAVFGHECVVASRSAQGNVGAQHSGRWVELDLATIFGFIHEVVSGPALTSEQIDWAVAEATGPDHMIPNSWTTRGDRTIGEGSKNKNLGNGRGLDHLEDVYGAEVVGIYFEALGH